MKTRLLFTLFVTGTLFWIAYSFFLIEKQQQTVSISTFFSPEQPVVFINRTDACLPETEITVNSVSLLKQIKTQTSLLWKSVAVQHFPDNTIRIVLEEQANSREDSIHSFLTNLGLTTTDFSLNKLLETENWKLFRTNGFVLLTNAKELNAVPTQDSLFSHLLLNRDRQSNYSIITKDKASDYYCHNGYNKEFIIENRKDQKLAAPVSDLDLYGVLPEKTGQFLFIEKSFLAKNNDKWNDEKLLSFIDRGVVFTEFSGNTIIYLDIPGNYVPQEVIQEYVKDKGALNSSIIRLDHTIGEFTTPYATALENVLVLSKSKDALEQIRLLYQMGTVFTSTSQFEQIRRMGAEKVHYRWYHVSEKIMPFEIPDMSGDFGHGVYKTETAQLHIASTRLTQNGGNTSDNSSVTSSTGKIIWNFTLENKNSRFFQNASSVCVYNPDKKTVSIVDRNGKVATWSQMKGNIKTIHPMENGFLVEQFDQLFWMSDSPPYDKKAIAFKGAIASTIAPYIWKNVPSIGLISENKLYRISLKDGSKETNNIPQSRQITEGQLHAFNHEGDLCFGLFTDSVFHIYNSKKNNWRTIELEGKVNWSAKINGKVHYLISKSNTTEYRRLFEDNPIGSAKINGKFFRTQYSGNTDPLFLFIQGDTLTASTATFSRFITIQTDVYKPDLAVVRYFGNNSDQIIVLDGVKNEMILYSPYHASHSAPVRIKASQFLKLTGKDKVITFVDGQLLMYAL